MITLKIIDDDDKSRIVFPFNGSSNEVTIRSQGPNS